ncbi:hypothetical protein DS2_09267 [Catenovulum agarivorans DS-2]|uniref:PEP-CTERM protein-sorting domain-containing protein n=1 Tax=Catenovulum agarivorans DS-2 TaxID=1328313 RepID=W7QBF1_9ALTE|nr:hypothetical protein [Catenovulum agarivorans]EWH10124.1 hypothetical protein DS2_09267 [Catenovulum agarivorans DS-2]
MRFYSVLKSAAIVSSLLFASQASAWEWTMDFDRYYDTNGVEQSIQMGDILSTQYQSGYVYDEVSGSVVDTGVGATIFADNYSSSADPDFAVALNTDVKKGVEVNGRRHYDADLQAPFTQAGGTEEYSPGNIVILQEDKSQSYWIDGQKQTINPEHTCFENNDTSQSVKGHCTIVDDEGRKAKPSDVIFADDPNDEFDVVQYNEKKSGHILIELTEDVTLKSINFFDIANHEDSYVITSDADGNHIETVQVPGMGARSASDRKWATVNFSEIETVRRIFISLGGSGGFSDIKLAKVAQEVSEPGMLAVFMLAIAGLAVRNRKSKLAA